MLFPRIGGWRETEGVGGRFLVSLVEVGECG